MSYPPSAAANVYKKVLHQCAAAICFTNGFDAAEQGILEVITHLMTSYLNAICSNSSLNCEIAGRTVVIPTDVWLALINMGHDVTKLPGFLSKISNGTLVIPPPKVQSPPQNNAPLRVGRCRPHPQHVNEFLPSFPDPHTYIRTEISGEPDTSYEKVREMASQRKRDTETSLINFMLRVHPRTSLFRDYETKLKDEAAKAMSERERQKDARKRARKQAKVAEKTQKSMTNNNSLPDQLIDDFLEDSNKEDAVILSDSEEEDDGFELEETENSIILRWMPPFCSVLDPSLETRPYLSTLEDENNESSSTDQRLQQTISLASDDHTYDNAFLRPPRIPTKEEYEEMEY
ncbi:unnamed protein product [Auanema sp. JU1783]|nr:unnamed protein product [Auanema sp. JU1783]